MMVFNQAVFCLLTENAAATVQLLDMTGWMTVIQFFQINSCLMYGLTYVYSSVSPPCAQCALRCLCLLRSHVHLSVTVFKRSNGWWHGNTKGAGIAWWLEHWACDWTVPGLSPSSSGRRKFLCRVDFLCFYLKDPSHSAKTAGGRLQLNTHAPYLCGFEWHDPFSHGTSHATIK